MGWRGFSAASFAFRIDTLSSDKAGGFMRALGLLRALHIEREMVLLKSVVKRSGGGGGVGWGRMEVCVWGGGERGGGGSGRGCEFSLILCRGLLVVDPRSVCLCLLVSDFLFLFVYPC